MKQKIPAAVIHVVSEIMSSSESHASMDSLFAYADAPGGPPGGSKFVKAQEWLRITNKSEALEPLAVLGRLIEPYMESPSAEQLDVERRNRLTETLERFHLRYLPGGVIAGTTGAPSRSLQQVIRTRDLRSVEDEFTRALENLPVSPREAVSAACNVLEAVCKTYIEDEGLPMPARQDLPSVWAAVRKDLNFDPSKVEDQDLQKILSGMISVVDGIGALRTHASSAHGAGRKRYSVEARHARLAVHAAHTIATFVLESWDRRKAPPRDRP